MLLEQCLLLLAKYHTPFLKCEQCIWGVLRSTLRSIWISVLHVLEPEYPLTPWRTNTQVRAISAKLLVTLLPCLYFWVRFGLWGLNKRKGMGTGMCLLPMFLMDQSYFPKVSGRSMAFGVGFWCDKGTFPQMFKWDSIVIYRVCIFKSRLSVYRYSAMLFPH